LELIKVHWTQLWPTANS